MVEYRRWYVANKWWSHIIGGSVVVNSAMVDFTFMFCTIVIVIESVLVTIINHEQIQLSITIVTVHQFLTLLEG